MSPQKQIERAQATKLLLQIVDRFREGVKIRAHCRCTSTQLVAQEKNIRDPRTMRCRACGATDWEFSFEESKQN